MIYSPEIVNIQEYEAPTVTPDPISIPSHPCSTFAPAKKITAVSVEPRITKKDEVKSVSEPVGVLKLPEVAHPHSILRPPTAMKDLPVINIRHVPHVINSPRVRFNDQVISQSFDPDFKFLS